MYNLNYWGESERETSRQCKNKALDPVNHLFLTLVKIKSQDSGFSIQIWYINWTSVEVRHNMSMLSIQTFTRNKLDSYN